MGPARAGGAGRVRRGRRSAAWRPRMVAAAAASMVGSQRCRSWARYIRASVLTDQYAQAGAYRDLTHCSLRAASPAFWRAIRPLWCLRTSGGTSSGVAWRGWALTAWRVRCFKRWRQCGHHRDSIIDWRPHMGAAPVRHVARPCGAMAFSFASGTQAANSFQRRCRCWS